MSNFHLDWYFMFCSPGYRILVFVYTFRFGAAQRSVCLQRMFPGNAHTCKNAHTVMRIDVTATREIMLFLGGHVDMVGKIFEVLQSGQIQLITLTADSTSLADLFDLKNRVVRGHTISKVGSLT